MRYFLLFYIFLLNIFAIDLKTFQSDFTQTISSDEQNITYQGQIFIKDENNLKWIYEKPIFKEVFFTNNQIISVEPELEQVIITSLKKSPNLAKILKNAKKINTKTYQATHENIIYTLKYEKNLPKSISYKDNFDNDIIITFQNQIINAKFDNFLFKPHIPPGFDIIR